MDRSQFIGEVFNGIIGGGVAGCMTSCASVLAGWCVGVRKEERLLDLMILGGQFGVVGGIIYLVHKGTIHKYTGMALGAVFGFEKIALVSLIYTLATQNNVHAEEITVSNNRDEEVSLESLELAGTVADGDGY